MLGTILKYLRVSPLHSSLTITSILQMKKQVWWGLGACPCLVKERNATPTQGYLNLLSLLELMSPCSDLMETRYGFLVPGGDCGFTHKKVYEV